MKKSLLLSITGITLVAVTATTLYAQTTAGTSIIEKMKEAMRPSFTLSADLNPGQTGYESAPVSGKKTGNMLTAAEWNRMLEIVAQGGVVSGGGTSSTGNRPIVCSKTANSGKATGYTGVINATFSAADCTGGVLPDTTTYAGAIQGMQVCGGVETFTIQGATVRIFTNNLCKWASGKDYYFTVLYVPL